MPDEDTEQVVFQPNNPIPSTKIHTFYRKDNFDLERTTPRQSRSEGINPWIGKFSIRALRPTPRATNSIVKVKARLNLHGVLNFESAYTVEEIEKEEEVPVTDPAAMDTDGDKDAATQDRGAQGQEAAAQGGPQDWSLASPLARTPASSPA